MLEAWFLLPLWYQYILVTVLGLVLGSFLEVVATRFHTNASLNGRSRCLSCAKVLSWFELVPVFSFLFLRGRCRGCSSCIPRRLLVVEFLMAGLVLSLYVTYGVSLLFLLLLFVVGTLMVISLYDLRHFVIPDELVVALVVLSALNYFVRYGLDLSYLTTHFMAALGVTLFFGALWAVSKGRWLGFGDVKLVAPLGFMLVPLSAFTFVIVSFWLGAIVMLSVMTGRLIIQRLFPQRAVAIYGKSITMKSEVPFAPFIIGSFLLTYLYRFDVLELMSTLTYALL